MFHVLLTAATILELVTAFYRDKLMRPTPPAFSPRHFSL
jgi:hypothetical protein